MTTRVLPVGAFVCMFRDTLESDPFFADLWLEGEITDLSRSGAGHMYFSLRDDEGCLKCVLFRGQALRSFHQPELGAQVAVHGGLSLYPRTGSVQLVTDMVLPAGLGAASLELEYLRQRLSSEGLFDPLRKRPVPSWPRTIGVVTSAHGAAWHDVQSVIARRFPLVTLVLAAAQVQGDGAADTIVAAIEALQQDGRADVLIIARGGGANDDLGAFNDERVVRAIFACQVPVVVGIGHATDRTLAEDAADLAAATPSAAAEMCVPSALELGSRVATHRSRLDWSLAAALHEARTAATAATSRLSNADPRTSVRQLLNDTSKLTEWLQRSTRDVCNLRRRDASAASTLLDALNPTAILHRGYAAVHFEPDGTPLFSTAQAAPGLRLVATLQDGTVGSVIESWRDIRPLDETSTQ